MYVAPFCAILVGLSHPRHLQGSGRVRVVATLHHNHIVQALLASYYVVYSSLFASTLVNELNSERNFWQEILCSRFEVIDEGEERSPPTG